MRLGPEAVISFRRGVREKNIDTWLTAGKLLGVGLGDLLGLPGRKPKMFADGGFTEEDSNLIDFNRARRQQYYNQVAQSFDTMVQPVAAALVLGSDAGVAFSRITEIANYAVDGLETLAAMPTPTVSDDQGKAQQLLNTGIGKSDCWCQVCSCKRKYSEGNPVYPGSRCRKRQSWNTLQTRTTTT